MATTGVKSWLEIKSAIDSVRESLKRAYDAYAATGTGASTLETSIEHLKDASKDLADSMATGTRITKTQSDAFKAASQEVRNATKAAREMAITYKGLELAAMNAGEMVAAGASKVQELTGSLKNGVGAALGFSVSLKALVDITRDFRRVMYESDRTAERYGESMSNLESAFRTIRSETEMSRKDFALLNNQIKSLYLGVPPTAKALANMVKELRGRVGYNDDVIKQTLESLVALQTRVPQIMDRVQKAWELAAAGQGGAAKKMALQTRLLLHQSGATRAEIEKVMMAMEPRGARGTAFLDFEKDMAKVEQKTKDAQLAIAKKLEPSLSIMANTLASIADILSGKVSSGFANATAMVVGFAAPVAIAVKTVTGLIGAMKVLGAASSVGPMGAFTGMGGMGALGGAGAGLFLGLSDYSRRKAGGETGPAAIAKSSAIGSASGTAGYLAFAVVNALKIPGPAYVKVGAAIAAGFIAALGTAKILRDKMPVVPNEEKEMVRGGDDFAARMAEQRVTATKDLVSEISVVTGLQEESAALSQEILKKDSNLVSVRATSLSLLKSIKDHDQRRLVIQDLLNKGLLTQKDVVTALLPITKDQATAEKEASEYVTKMLEDGKERYSQASALVESLDAQVKQYQMMRDALSGVAQYAATIAGLQARGLQRTGFEDAFSSAVSASEGQAQMASRSAAAKAIQISAVETGTGDVADFINLEKLNPENKQKVERSIETLAAIAEQQISKQALRFNLISEVGASEPNKEQLAAIQAVEDQLASLDNQRAEIVKFLGGSINVDPSWEKLNAVYSDLDAKIKEGIASGKLSSIEYEAQAKSLGELGKALGEMSAAQQAYNDAVAAEATSKNASLLANQEKSTALAKSRLQYTQAAQLGLAPSWEQTKNVVGQLEREIQLLEQASDAYTQKAIDMAQASGYDLRLNFKLADTDYEAFVADIVKQLENQINKERGVVKSKEEQVTRSKEIAKIVDGISTQTGMRLDKEQKILATGMEQLELTKNIREGWLEAIQGSMTGAGSMIKIIGTQSEGTRQLTRYGAEGTWKYGSPYERNSRTYNPNERINPGRYTPIFGMMAGSMDPTAFRHTDAYQRTSQTVPEWQRREARANLGTMAVAGTNASGMEAIQSMAVGTVTDISIGSATINWPNGVNPGGGFAPGQGWGANGPKNLPPEANFVSPSSGGGASVGTGGGPGDPNSRFDGVTAPDQGLTTAPADSGSDATPNTPGAVPSATQSDWTPARRGGIMGMKDGGSTNSLNKGDYVIRKDNAKYAESLPGFIVTGGVPNKDSVPFSIRGTNDTALVMPGEKIVDKAFAAEAAIINNSKGEFSFHKDGTEGSWQKDVAQMSKDSIKTLLFALGPQSKLAYALFGGVTGYQDWKNQEGVGALFDDLRGYQAHNAVEGGSNFYKELVEVYARGDELINRGGVLNKLRGNALKLLYNAGNLTEASALMFSDGFGRNQIEEAKANEQSKAFEKTEKERVGRFVETILKNGRAPWDLGEGKGTQYIEYDEWLKGQPLEERLKLIKGRLPADFDFDAAKRSLQIRTEKELQKEQQKIQEKTARQAMQTAMEPKKEKGKVLVTDKHGNTTLISPPNQQTKQVQQSKDFGSLEYWGRELDKMGIRAPKTQEQKGIFTPSSKGWDAHAHSAGWDATADQLYARQRMETQEEINKLPRAMASWDSSDPNVAKNYQADLATSVSWNSKTNTIKSSAADAYYQAPNRGQDITLGDVALAYYGSKARYEGKDQSPVPRQLVASKMAPKTINIQRNPEYDAFAEGGAVGGRTYGKFGLMSPSGGINTPIGEISVTSLYDSTAEKNIYGRSRIGRYRRHHGPGGSSGSGNYGMGSLGRRSNDRMASFMSRNSINRDMGISRGRSGFSSRLMPSSFGGWKGNVNRNASMGTGRFSRQGQMARGFLRSSGGFAGGGGTTIRLENGGTPGMDTAPSNNTNIYNGNGRGGIYDLSDAAKQVLRAIPGDGGYGPSI